MLLLKSWNILLNYPKVGIFCATIQVGKFYATIQMLEYFEHEFKVGIFDATIQ